MIRCLDIHSHHKAPQPLGVISSSLDDFEPINGQLYSLGFHPWSTDESPDVATWEKFGRLAAEQCVVAIGECGIDLLKGGPLFRQLLIMKKQIEISERLEKPLIIHDVKAHDIIIGLKRDLKPRQKWLVHGFRAKPAVGQMLAKAGINLSFGEKFNPETLHSVPEEMLFAETDESSLTIEEIIGHLSAERGYDLTERIAENTARFLNLDLLPNFY